jgi:hypothetical protein
MAEVAKRLTAEQIAQAKEGAKSSQSKQPAQPKAQAPPAR